MFNKLKRKYSKKFMFNLINLKLINRFVLLKYYIPDKFLKLIILIFKLLIQIFYFK